MAKKSRSREITITEEGGAFSAFFKKFTSESSSFDFEGLAAFRQLLSNEKARILHVLKIQNPRSLYGLSKILKRDFKSVRQDLKLLERFGFIDMIIEKTGKRRRLKPVIAVESIIITIKP